jgi:pilus assembly protein CpaF
MAIKNIAHLHGAYMDTQNPALEVRLSDGSRVAALASPNSLSGWTLTVRRHVRWFSLSDLISAGTITAEEAEALCDAARKGLGILISGGTSSGKTTLLSAILAEIPAHCRLILIEQPAEIRVEKHANVLRWEATPERPNRPAVTPTMLVAHAMRHRPDYLIIGELRDTTAFDFLIAMNSGHAGMSTIHANSPVLALEKLSSLALGAHPNLNHDFVRQQTAEAIQVLAHMARAADGTPRLQSLERVLPYAAAGCFRTSRVGQNPQDRGDPRPWGASAHA